MATESDNVNSGALGTVIAVGTIAFFGIALVVTALVRTEMSEEVEKKDVSADRPYKDLLAEQQSKLNGSAAFINRNKGTVSLPIERAMELTVDGLKKDPNSATPPAPATGGAGGAAAAAGGGGAGGAGGGSAGAGGATPGTSNPPPAVAPTGTVGAEKPPQEPKDKEKTEAEKKKAPKKAPTPPLPAPAAPPPAPAAPAAPNGQ
jgi:hypothetical protein